MLLLLRVEGPLSPCTVRYISSVKMGDSRVGTEPNFFGHYEVLNRDPTLEDLGPFLSTKVLDQTQILMTEQHPTCQLLAPWSGVDSTYFKQTSSILP